jgi:hypothetical protein
MQELTKSIKRANLRIMGIEEGEEVRAKGITFILRTFPFLSTSALAAWGSSELSWVSATCLRGKFGFLVDGESSETTPVHLN